MSKPASNQIPTWLTIGFAVGLGCGAMYFRGDDKHAAPAASAPAPAEPDRKEIPRDAGSLAALEETFQRWGGYAVWENDVTEFAAWDPRRRKHSDFVEVRRAHARFYFRTLRALTRPLIDHGPRSVMPLAFTEPQAMRDKFYRENPNYDRDAEPIVALPPRPPAIAEVFDRVAAGSASSLPPDAVYPQPPPPPLTPGAGK